MPKYILVNLKDMLTASNSTQPGENDLSLAIKGKKTVVLKDAVSVVNRLDTLASEPHNYQIIFYSNDPTEDELTFVEDLKSASRQKGILAPYLRAILNKNADKSAFFAELYSTLSPTEKSNVYDSSAEMLHAAKIVGFNSVHVGQVVGSFCYNLNKKLEGLAPVKTIHIASKTDTAEPSYSDSKSDLKEESISKASTPKGTGLATITISPKAKGSLITPESDFEKAMNGIRDQVATLKSERDGCCFAFFTNTQRKQQKINFLNSILTAKPTSLETLKQAILNAKRLDENCYKTAIAGVFSTRTKDLLFKYAPELAVKSAKVVPVQSVSLDVR